ncbi:MAG: methyltransferase domain-containing protein [Candidatus Lokiarchaeota archaeon]|nr:methyltransferase domain-containing protein [Candidatus Lokiarchaeota archaeon]
MDAISKLVEQGYNRIAEDYYSHRNLSKFNNELEEFASLLPKNAHTLDVGCGAGIPTAKFLTERGIKVTGIDLSDKMLNLARDNVPNAKFVKMDMIKLEFNENTFDGIISVFALFHVPKENHYDVFKKFFEILKPGGILMINSGVSESEGTSRFFGVPMFWSNFSPKTTLDLVKKAGFSIISEAVLERGGEYQYWVFGKKS